MEIFERNGFIIVPATPDTMAMNWLTYYRNRGSEEMYFLANQRTRYLFKRDLWPLRNKFKINKTVIEILRDSELIFPDDNPVKLIEPEGITLTDYQKEALEYMRHNKKFCIFLGAGTGKTLIAISFILSKQPDKVIVYTPNRVKGQYTKECKKYLKNYEIVCNPDDFANHKGKVIFITNYEQSHNHLNVGNIDCMILDESHKAKDISNNVTDNLRKIGRRSKRTYLFSGTPQDKTRYEVLSQLSILDERFAPMKTRLINRYFEVDDYKKPTQREKQKGELDIMIGDISFGRTSDYLMPELKEEELFIKVPSNTYYERFLNDKIIHYKGETLIGDTTGGYRSGLRCLSSGFFYKKGTKVPIIVDDTKKEYLKRLINTKVDKGIIVGWYNPGDIDIITSALDELGKTYVVLPKGATDKVADELIDKFKTSKADFFVMQARSGNAGLDFYHVNKLIFFTIPDSYVVYHQSKRRIKRKGQDKVCQYYYLLTDHNKSVDKEVYNTVKRKRSFSNQLFRLFLRGAGK